MRRLIVMLLAFGVFGATAAGGLSEGEKEAAFRVSYSDTDLGSSSGVDLGSTKNTDLSITYGWLLTDRHELGFTAGYTKEDISGGDVDPDSEIDGTRFGGFYNLNFKTKSNVTPYIGASISTLGGDLGDAFDLQYGAEVGVKIYPFKHGGFSFGLAYSQLKADAPGLDDADSINLGAGLLLKY